MSEESIIQEEDLFFEQAPAKEDSNYFVNFTLGSEWFGIEINRVKEVVKVPPITYLPGAPGHLVGIVNLRGSILTVTDLKRIFGFEKTKSNAENRIVVLEHEGLEAGFLADRVLELIDLPVSKIEPPLQTLQGAAAEYIEGESKINNRILIILNTGKLFKLGRGK